MFSISRYELYVGYVVYIPPTKLETAAGLVVEKRDYIKLSQASLVNKHKVKYSLPWDLRLLQCTACPRTYC
jgi:hypothetical protein